MPNRLLPGQPRDSQRQRLYDSEHVLRGVRASTAAKRHLTDSVRHSDVRVIYPDGTRGALYYPSVESTQDYVDAVLASAWFRRRWGMRSITVGHSHGRGSSGGYGEVSMGVEHRRSEEVILHEIAHNLSSFSCAYHGPEFAGVLLTLVKHVMGAEHAATLRASYRLHRVRYSLSQVPAPDEARRRQADARAKRRGVVVPRATRTPTSAQATAAKRRPAKRIETVEEMREVGRRAGLRGSDWDRAEASATSRGTGDLRFERGRRAFSDGYARGAQEREDGED